MTCTGYLADKCLGWQLAIQHDVIQDDAEVANTGGGTGDVIPESVWSMFSIFLHAGFGAKPDGLSL